MLSLLANIKTRKIWKQKKLGCEFVLKYGVYVHRVFLKCDVNLRGNKIQNEVFRSSSNVFCGKRETVFGIDNTKKDEGKSPKA